MQINPLKQKQTGNFRAKTRKTGKRAQVGTVLVLEEISLGNKTPKSRGAMLPAVHARKAQKDALKMNINLRLAALAALGLLAFAPAANAQVSFPADATINYAINDDVNVGMDAAGSPSDSSGNPYNPTVNVVTGANISGSIYSYNNSVVNMSGGAVSAFYTNDTSTFNLTGGAIRSGIFVYDSNTVNLYGGSIGGNLLIFHAGAINFFGTGFSSVLLTPDDGSGFSDYTISGILSDGTVLTQSPLFISNGDGGAFTFNAVGGASVPEPGSLALLVGMVTVGAGVLRRNRRK